MSSPDKVMHMHPDNPELQMAFNALTDAQDKWFSMRKTRRKVRPSNYELYQQTWKDARAHYEDLLSVNGSKKIKSEILTNEMLQSTLENPITLFDTEGSGSQEIEVVPDDEAGVQVPMPTEKVSASGTPNKSNDARQAPMSTENMSLTAAPNKTNEAGPQVPMPTPKVSGTGATIDIHEPSQQSSIARQNVSVTGSPNNTVRAAVEKNTIHDEDIDPALKVIPHEPQSVPRLREVPEMPSHLPVAAIIAPSTMFPIPPKLLKELDDCTAESTALLRKIQELEVDLCAPAQRTMEEIRSKLIEIDAGYVSVQSIEKRVTEIQNIIADGERAFTSNERRKYLLKRKAILDRQRDDGEAEMINLTMEDLPEYQRKRNLLMAEIDSVKLELQKLVPSKSNKAGKTTNIRSKFAKAARSARKANSAGRDKGSEKADNTDDKDDSDGISEEEDDEETHEVDGKRKSTRSDPSIGRKRTKAQLLMLDVVYGDELAEEEEANRTGLRDFQVDDWDCEEDMKEEANWAAMTPIQRIEYCDAIIRSIQRFEKSGNLQDFRPKYRRSLRHVQSLLPEKCFESRRVTVAIHMTSHGNLICRFHKRHPKQKFFDNGPGLYRVQGVPKAPVYRYWAEEAATPLRERGYMSCGCLIDDVLLEFYFWKTLKISSPLQSLHGVEEPMRGDVFQPRHRAFLIKVFKDHSMLTADDIYNPNRPRGLSKQEREVRLLDISISRLARLWLEKTGIEMKIVFPHREAGAEKMMLDDVEAAAKQAEELSTVTMVE